jgi:hypothetical protein
MGKANGELRGTAVVTALDRLHRFTLRRMWLIFGLVYKNFGRFGGPTLRLSLAAAATAVTISAFGVLSQAGAAIVTFSGGDAGANSTSPHPKSNAAAASFDASAGALGTENLITFESSPVGAYSSLVVAPGVTLTGTDYTGNSSGQSILKAPFGNPTNLFGYNTTIGGSKFAFINGGFVTFSFATPIQAFGAYLSGLQFDDETFMFSDGSSLTITIPNFGSGVQFEGFTDAGKLISSVEINTTSATNTSGDFVGVDDVRFVAGDPPGPVNGDPGPAIPESSTWAMMLLGFASLGYLAYVRARRARVASADA